MLVYGIWMDANFTVKYTDIDYQVFTDAARYVFDGYTPYLRATYRYTPLLAWLLTPNIWFFNSFGKVMFIVFDCIVGYLLYEILVMRGLSSKRATMYSALWLLNPQVANISTRGSAESMIGAATLGCFYMLMQKQLDASAVLFGLAVHLKIYPIVYALPILLCLESRVFEGRPPTLESQQEEGNQRTGVATRFLKNWVNRYRVRFGVISALTFLLLNLVMYFIYGDQFIEETYLYHVTRKDHRHNFSIWFLPIYLDFKSASSGFISLASFVPQLLVVAVLGLKFGKDLPFAALVQTFAFVAYNKVCTAQALYLREAYAFEFLGQNKFVELWLCGVIMFICNNGILVSLLKNQKFVPLFNDKDGNLTKIDPDKHEKTA
ncbi:GPI mannosyltransferase 1 [Mycoemilia scoparia]|uniref:GPI mannosyltransferase 1 n=1 Tax=Mycoemilia scoparia TaxID=417184 RepID=A0A9W8DLC9_9FUNG|nr:GPI mannosyltransferase 1 [Mycoemilia scoparia]